MKMIKGFVVAAVLTGSMALSSVAQAKPVLPVVAKAEKVTVAEKSEMNGQCGFKWRQPRCWNPCRPNPCKPPCVPPTDGGGAS